MLRSVRNSRDGYGLIAYSSSPRNSYASPRHVAFNKNKTSTAVVAIQAGAVLLLFVLALWWGVNIYTSPNISPAALDLDPDCPDCGHGRSPKADFGAASDLSIKLASRPSPRGRKDLYPENQADASARYKSSSSQAPLSDNYSIDSETQQPKQQQTGKGAANNDSYATRSSQQRPTPLPTPSEAQLQEQTPHQRQTGPIPAPAAPIPAAASQQDQPAEVPVPAASGGAVAASDATAAATASAAAATDAAGAGVAQPDPLHDNQQESAKEAEQLAALSHVVQQQQDTIGRQSKALMELQKRFVQQERQLQAATATAAATNTSDGAEVEPYFPQERVQLELDMLHKVEAQIDEVSAGVAAATAVLPTLTREQQAAQVRELARADQLMGRLSRVAAAISLRTSDPLTEGGHDPVSELRHYYGAVASNNVTLSWQSALSRQSRPTAASLGITHVEPYADAEDELASLDLRVEYAQAELATMHAKAPCQLSLVTTWAGDLWGLRRELLPWITYHAQLGFSKLYVLYEGGDKNTLEMLHDMAPFVRVMLASAPLADSAQVGEYDAWLRTVPDSHIKEWSSQPGNYALMTKQGFAVTKALERARADQVTWLIHMDPDELLHPAAAHTAGDIGSAFSLLPELCGTPDTVPSIRFVNIEGVPEAADLVNRYEQVTLFRAHRHLVPPAAQPYRYIFKQGHADAWLHLYTNGKSAVRPDAPGVSQGGPHVFLGPADKRWVTPDNPHGMWRPVISNSSLVLHYAYATPGDVAVKAGRSCPQAVVDAVLAGDTAQASQCFVLDIDQRAFMAAIKDRKAAGLSMPPGMPALPAAPGTADAGSNPATGTADPTHGRELLVDVATVTGLHTSSEFSNASWPVGQEVLDFFWGELALSEGAPFECLTSDGKAKGWCAMTSVGQLKSLLISSGLMMRMHAPSQAMKGIESALRQIINFSGRQSEVRQAEKMTAAAAAAAAAAAVKPTSSAQEQPGVARQLLQDQQQQQVAGVASSEPQAAGVAGDAAAGQPASSANTAPSASSSGAAASADGATDDPAASDALTNNDNKALSTDSRPTDSGSSSTDTASSSGDGSVAGGVTSNAPVTPEDVARETGLAVDDAKTILNLADQVGKDVAEQAVKHADATARVPKSAIRDKLLLT